MFGVAIIVSRSFAAYMDAYFILLNVIHNSLQGAPRIMSNPTLGLLSFFIRSISSHLNVTPCLNFLAVRNAAKY